MNHILESDLEVGVNSTIIRNLSSSNNLTMVPILLIVKPKSYWSSGPYVILALLYL